MDVEDLSYFFSMYVCMYVSMYVCMYVGMYVCMYVYVCMYYLSTDSNLSAQAGSGPSKAQPDAPPTSIA